MKPHVRAVQLIREAMESGKIVVLGISNLGDIVLDPQVEGKMTPEYLEITTPDRVVFYIPWESIAYVKIIPP